jgi:hypothetical protein
MTTRHEPWDARLATRLDDLRIGVISGAVDPAITRITESLRRYGFALLSGLGGRHEGDATAYELIDLATRLGTVVAQSPRGEQVEDVRDFSDVEAQDERGYRSRGELSPHSDPPTLIVLHCLQPAKSGGESYIVNVRSIHERMAAVSPALLAELYQGFPHWRVAGQYGNPEPGPARHRRPIFAMHDGLVSCVYYRPFIEMSAGALGEPLTAAQVAAMDLFDKCASAPELALRFPLQPGQTLLLHNRTVLHARTDYQDWPQPEQRRHLLRVWIDAPEMLPVASVHELGDLFAAP